jgi:hypothetical protein
LPQGFNRLTRTFLAHTSNTKSPYNLSSSFRNETYGHSLAMRPNVAAKHFCHVFRRSLVQISIRRLTYFVVLLTHSRQIPFSYLKSCHERFFHVLPSAPFTNHPTIRRRTVFAADSDVKYVPIRLCVQSMCFAQTT